LRSSRGTTEPATGMRFATTNSTDQHENQIGPVPSLRCTVLGHRKRNREESTLAARTELTHGSDNLNQHPAVGELSGNKSQGAEARQERRAPGGGSMNRRQIKQQAQAARTENRAARRNRDRDTERSHKRKGKRGDRR
jgi:hypothetical protein